MSVINTNSAIEAKKLDSFLGTFVIRDYQRGYRWEKAQVWRLLEDIWQSVINKNNYFLQPMVVRRAEPMLNLVANDSRQPKSDVWWELIDGQQRLTTLYLAISYADRMVREQNESTYQSDLNFRIVYETRPSSSEFLRTLGYGFEADSIIDFYYMNQAIECIGEWFNRFGISSRIEAMSFYTEVIKRTMVLWYDPGSKGGQSEDIFNRLNIGKIPLTSAELLRAWFLSEDIDLNSEDLNPKTRKLEIGLQWDDIEYNLAEPAFWAFITNESIEKYDTKIDLLMEMAARRHGARQLGGTGNSRLKGDSYASFYALSGMDGQGEPQKDVLKLWQKIYRDYQLLRYWYDDRILYHKIGYLITVKKSIDSLLAEAQNLGREAFMEFVDECIKETIQNSPPLEALSYDKDKLHVFNHLLLFNILSVLGGEKSPNIPLQFTERYPFAIHKQVKHKWSIEHIHAQQDVGLNTKEQWQIWIKEHMEAFKGIEVTQLLTSCPEGVDNLEWKQEFQLRFDKVEKNLMPYSDPSKLESVRKEEFEELAKHVAKLFEHIDPLYDVHSLENLALLRQANNSALSNDIFEVKRLKIRRLDKQGEFIPLCTKRLFMRYYDDDDGNELPNRPYWSMADRKAYISAIRNVLSSYLTEHSTEGQQ